MSAALGERLRDECEWVGFSPDLVANALCLATPDILAFEAGDREPTSDQLARLAELYGLSVERLRGEPLAEEPGGLQALAGRNVSSEDRYQVMRFAEYLRHAGQAPKVDRS